MTKENALLIKKTVKELGDKEWRADEDGRIYWDYVSKDKPAFEIFVGKEHVDEDGTSTRVFATDLTMNEVFKYTYAGTDHLLCDYSTIEEAICAVVKSVIRKAKYLY